MSACEVAAVVDAALGASLATGDPVALEPYRLDGVAPRALVRPQTPEHVARMLALAAERGWAVVPWGRGHGQGCGDVPRRYDVALSLRRLDAIPDLDADNLTVTAEAGISLGELTQRLGERHLVLPLALGDGERTLGGLIAANRAGCKRLLYGDPRDLLLGLRVALPNGALVRYGRKVIKNVAGYDMPKLYLGSQGLLGVVVEATFKVQPLPDREGVLIAGFSGGPDAARAAQALFRSALGPACLMLLLGRAVQSLRRYPGLDVPEGRAVLVVAFDGRSAAVQRQMADAGRVLLAQSATGVAELPALAAETAAMLEDAAHGLHPEQPRVVLRLGVLPTQVADAMAQAVGTMNVPGTSFGAVGDYSAGRIDLLLTGEPHIGWERLDGRIHELRRAMGERGGSVVLAAAPRSLKAKVGVWGDLQGAGRIMQRIKAQLDPRQVLSPGRFLPDPAEG
ncbi:MAG: FAD-binding oxidoreductase [Candidatus Lambdaproteobacteria bacterium]|nr:FAD-binding oxidoreductase [Candidatus Lambdaproteobacteria bacterium]